MIDQTDKNEFKRNGGMNCVIDAFSRMLDLSYLDTWGLIKEFVMESRQDLSELHKKGMKSWDTEIIAEKCGAELIYHKYALRSQYIEQTEEEKEYYRIYGHRKKRLTVNRALKDVCLKGRYMIAIKDHVFAVIDGKIMKDWIWPDSRHGIHYIYKFPN